MTVNANNINPFGPNTGIVVVVFRDPDTPPNTDAIIERTVTSASVADPNAWQTIGTIFNCDTAGSQFIDYLPLTDDVYWYRAKHVAVGYEDSDYIFERSGKADIIPDIDLNTKPWLLNQSPLQLVMYVSQSNSTSWTIAPEVNQPVFNVVTIPPTVTVLSAVNVGTIVAGTEPNTFVVDKPTGPAASEFSSVVFKSSLPQFLDGYDRVDLAPAGSGLQPSDFLNLVLNVTSSTATTLGVSASVDTTVPYGFDIVSFTNVGTITNDAFGQWTIGRPTSGEGSVTFIVTSSVAGVISDTDTIYVSKDPAPYLTVQAKATAVTENTVTASVDIYDSNNQDSTLTGITLTATSQSLAGFTASLAGTVTQTNGKDSYVYHITRPSYQQGTGRVSFTATKNGYTQDSDALDVPERVDQLAKLRTIITPVGTDANTITVSVAVLDALPLAGSYINLSYNSIGIPNVVPTGSAILSASEARQYVITRPNFGSGTGRVNFTATASLRVNDTDSVDVPERSQFSTNPAAATITIVGATSASNQIVVQYSFASTSTAEKVEVFVQESSGSAPPLSSVEYTGTQPRGTPLHRNDNRQFLTLPVAFPGNWLSTTFVPYDTFNRRGTILNARYQALTSSLTTPDGFPSATNLSTGSTFVSNSVEMPASNLPDKIRVELFGAPFGSDITRTATAGNSQTIVHTGLNAATLYTWQYFPVNNNGAIGPGSDFVITETAGGGQLPVPEFTYNAQEIGGVWFVYFNIINGDDYPPNVNFFGEIYDSTGFNLLGSPFEQSQYTYYWETTNNTTGYAQFKAFLTGYQDSDYSDQLFWFAGSGQPF
jgi:hypothetical protein